MGLEQIEYDKLEEAMFNLTYEFFELTSRMMSYIDRVCLSDCSIESKYSNVLATISVFNNYVEEYVRIIEDTYGGTDMSTDSIWFDLMIDDIIRYFQIDVHTYQSLQNTQKIDVEGIKKDISRFHTIHGRLIHHTPTEVVWRRYDSIVQLGRKIYEFENFDSIEI